MATSVISTIQLPDQDQSALMNAQPRHRRRGYLLLDGDHTLVGPLLITSPVIDRFPSHFTFGENSTAIFKFGIVLDPLSESAQKWSSLLLWLLNIPGVSVDLRIHPNVYTEVSFKISTSGLAMLIAPGPPQTVLSIQPQTLCGV